MRNKIIIYISVIGLLTGAIIMSNMQEVQSKNDKSSTTLFKYLPVNGWSDD